MAEKLDYATPEPRQPPGCLFPSIIAFLIIAMYIAWTTGHFGDIPLTEQKLPVAFVVVASNVLIYFIYFIYRLRR